MRLRLGKLVFGILLALGATSAQATEPIVYPPSGVQVFLGLDDTSAPTQVQDGRAQDLQNVKLSISKDLRKRYGDSLVGSTLDIAADPNCTVTGIYYTKFSSGTERIIATCGNRFDYLNGTAWSTVTGVNVAITAGQNNQFVFTTALDEIIGTNGVNPPLRYNGTTLDTVNFTSLSAASRPSAAKTVAFFKNFLIFGNTTENGVAYKTRIRWSNVGTTSTWTDADYVDIGALGGQEITGMAELYDNLYVFLTDSIYRVSFVAGADTFQISKVSDTIGCIAKNSIQSITLTNAQNGLIFLSKNKKIYFLNGITVHDITPLIKITMNNLSSSRLQYAVSATSPTDYYLCATNGAGSTNDLCVDYEYEIGEWTKYTNIPANAMARVLDSNGKVQVYFGTSESFVYQLENTSLVNDVGGVVTGIVSVVNTYATSTASAQQVLYITGANYTTGALAGAPILLTGGAGSGLTSTLSYNTASGLVVTDDFSTTPNATTTVQVGGINAYYTSKWYDLGQAARLKSFGELYFWAEASTPSTLSVSYATDYNADISTQSISLSADANDSIWGTATWGVSLWGSANDVFRQVKLEDQGRYLRYKFADADVDQTFHLYGMSILAWLGLNN